MSEPWEEADFSASAGADLPLAGLLEELLQADEELVLSSDGGTPEVTAGGEERLEEFAEPPCLQEAVPMRMTAALAQIHGPLSGALQVYLRLPARRWPASPQPEAFAWSNYAPATPEVEAVGEAPPAPRLDEWLAAHAPDFDLPLPERFLRPLRSVMDEVDREMDGAPAVDLSPHREQARQLERFLVFQVQSTSLAVPLGQVLEVDRVPRVARVPGASESLCGLVNLRGEIVPLLDLRAMLDLPSPPAGIAGRLVVVRRSGEDGPCAVKVDSLGGIALLDPTALESPAPELDSHIVPWVTGASVHRNRPVQLFDLNRLLAAQPEWAAEA